MQNDTKRKKRKASAICATIVIAILGTFLATIVFPLIGETHGQRLAFLFLVIYGGGILAVMIGILLALRQRLKEIENGEEEEAKQY